MQKLSCATIQSKIMRLMAWMVESCANDCQLQVSGSRSCQQHQNWFQSKATIWGWCPHSPQLTEKWTVWVFFQISNLMMSGSLWMCFNCWHSLHWLCSQVPFGFWMASHGNIGSQLLSEPPSRSVLHEGEAPLRDSWTLPLRLHLSHITLFLMHRDSGHPTCKSMAIGCMDHLKPQSR